MGPEKSHTVINRVLPCVESDTFTKHLVEPLVYILHMYTDD